MAGPGWLHNPFHKPTINTNGPFGTSTLGRVGNTAGHIGAVGLGNALGGPLGGAGVNWVWNKIFGKPTIPIGNQPLQPSGNGLGGILPPSPFMFGGGTFPTGILSNPSGNPFFGGFGMNPTSGLPLGNFGGFSGLLGGGIQPPPNVMDVPISGRGPLNGVTINPLPPNKPVTPSTPSNFSPTFNYTPSVGTLVPTGNPLMNLINNSPLGGGTLAQTISQSYYGNPNSSFSGTHYWGSNVALGGG